MMWLPNSVAILLLVLAQHAVESQNTRNADDEGTRASSGHENRQLQLKQGDKATGSITSRSCEYLDSFTDPRLVCGLQTRFSSSSGSVDVDVALNCSSSSSTFSFRDVADACQCKSVFTDLATGQPIECPCAACPDGFGANPIFVNCGADVALIDACSSIDCDYTCNGSNVTEILTAPPTGPPTTSAPTKLSTAAPSRTMAPISADQTSGGVKQHHMSPFLLLAVIAWRTIV